MKLHLLPLATILLLATHSPLFALVIRTFDPSVHFRFTGFPESPQINPTFLNATGNPATLLDLTGVGWSDEDPNRQLTLVSPRHFVGANHYRPAVGSKVVLLSPGNVVQSYTIASISSVPNDNNTPSDLYLGELTQDIPAATGIRPLPYLNVITEAEFVGKPIVVLGRTARGGRGTIGGLSNFNSGVQTRACTFTYNTSIGQNDDAYCEIGDSGSPSLAIVLGKPALVGTHTAIFTVGGSITTYDTLVPHYAPVLNTLMEPAGYHMIKFTPPVTIFATSGGAPASAVRALKPFTLTSTLINGLAIAENISATFSPVPTAAAATGWINKETATLCCGGMNSSATSNFSLTFPGIPQSGFTVVSMTVTSDGSGTQVFQFPVTVLPSYAEWSASLADSSYGGDPDHDNIPNLLEYAFGDGQQNISQLLPNIPALPNNTTPTTLSYLRRSDYIARGLSYILESSDTLAPDSWETIAPSVLSNISLPIPGMEQITISLLGGVPKRFFRMRVELAE